MLPVESRYPFVGEFFISVKICVSQNQRTVSGLLTVLINLGVLFELIGSIISLTAWSLIKSLRSSVEKMLNSDAWDLIFRRVPVCLMKSMFPNWFRTISSFKTREEETFVPVLPTSFDIKSNLLVPLNWREIEYFACECSLIGPFDITFAERSFVLSIGSTLILYFAQFGNLHLP